jgi:hypothetical protein
MPRWLELSICHWNFQALTVALVRSPESSVGYGRVISRPFLAAPPGGAGGDRPNRCEAPKEGNLNGRCLPRMLLLLGHL